MLRRSLLFAVFALAALDLAAQTPARKVLFHVRLIELDDRAETLLIDRSASPAGFPTVGTLDPSLDIFGLFEEIRASGAEIHFLAATNASISNNHSAKVFQDDNLMIPLLPPGGKAVALKRRTGVQLELQPSLIEDGRLQITARLSTAVPQARLVLAPGQSFWISGLADRAPRGNMSAIAVPDPLIRFIAHHSPAPGVRQMFLITPEIVPQP